MIKDVADLLAALAGAEAKRLANMDITHPGTIGGMYEGLTKQILSRAIPTGLDLKIVDGFIVDGGGEMSGQIDCMLVCGEGEEIPYSPGAYKWHVKDVIAVIEVKKSLYGAELADAFDQLRSVMSVYSSWIQKGEGSGFSILPTQKAYAQMTGEIAPPGAAWKTMPMDKHMVLSAVMTDQLAPIRIILGYEGFKTEAGLRTTFSNFMAGRLLQHGHGPLHLPNLIAARQFSLVKLNGHPYTAPLLPDGRWPLLASAHFNPIHHLLEMVWTRLSYSAPLSELFGEDLDIEAFSPFLYVKPGQTAANPPAWGWHCSYDPATEKELAATPTHDKWSPVVLNNAQFVIVNELCNGDDVNIDDPELKQFVEKEVCTIDDFIDGLIETRLVAREGNTLRLATTGCSCMILPDGRYVAAENNSGRLTRWVLTLSTNSKPARTRADAIDEPPPHPRR